jgi:hypothetical protein
MALQILAELDVLFVNGVLSYTRQTEPRQSCRKQGKGGSYPKGILPGFDRVRAGVLLEGGEGVGPAERTNFSHCGGEAVVLASAGCKISRCGGEIGGQHLTG